MRSRVCSPGGVAEIQNRQESPLPRAIIQIPLVGAGHRVKAKAWQNIHISAGAAMPLLARKTIYGPTHIHASPILSAGCIPPSCSCPSVVGGHSIAVAVVVLVGYSDHWLHQRNLQEAASTDGCGTPGSEVPLMDIGPCQMFFTITVVLSLKNCSGVRSTLKGSWHFVRRRYPDSKTGLSAPPSTLPPSIFSRTAWAVNGVNTPCLDGRTRSRSFIARSCRNMKPPFSAGVGKGVRSERQEENHDRYSATVATAGCRAK